MGEHYILRGKEAVPADLMEWARFFETDQRRVGLDEPAPGVSVSTVFIGLDHQFGNGPPLIFETLVQGGPNDQDMDRYSTWEEAEAGHARMVAANVVAPMTAPANPRVERVELPPGALERFGRKRAEWGSRINGKGDYAVGMSDQDLFVIDALLNRAALSEPSEPAGGEVREATECVRRIRANVAVFDGDRRGHYAALEEAEQALVKTALRAHPTPERSDAAVEALRTVRDYVSDAAQGYLVGLDGNHFKAMAAEDLKRIDAALLSPTNTGGDLVARLQEALDAHDATERKCPVNYPVGGQVVRAEDDCPRCGSRWAGWKLASAHHRRAEGPEPAPSTQTGSSILSADESNLIRQMGAVPGAWPKARPTSAAPLDLGAVGRSTVLETPAQPVERLTREGVERFVRSALARAFNVKGGGEARAAIHQGIVADAASAILALAHGAEAPG